MSDSPIRFQVPDGGHRLDRLVADATGRGRRAVRQWFRQGDVRVDGRLARASDTPAADSEVVVAAVTAAPDTVHSATGPVALQRVVETPEFLVVFKPAGLHCERGRSEGSLADLLEQDGEDLSRIGDRPEEAGLVHRIDRDTSGLVVAARERATYARLRDAFRAGRTRKQYLALASGRLERQTEVDLPLRRLARSMAPATDASEAAGAQTSLVPLETTTTWSLVLATMHTGVMHQVRCHLAALGHPLFGDTLYGGPTLEAGSRQGQLLHAVRVQVDDEIDVSAGPPADFLQDYARLKRTGG